MRSALLVLVRYLQGLLPLKRRRLRFHSLGPLGIQLLLKLLLACARGVRLGGGGGGLRARRTRHCVSVAQPIAQGIDLSLLLRLISDCSA